MKFILIVIAIFLDVFLNNVFNFGIYSLTYFYPMFTVATISYLSNLYNNANRKNYYVLVLIVSILYDSIIINNLLISITVFLSIAFINVKLKNNLSNNLINNILRLILSIICYDIIFYLLLVVVGYQNFDINRLVYKITHSIIINVIYMSIMFLVLKEKKP